MRDLQFENQSGCHVENPVHPDKQVPRIPVDRLDFSRPFQNGVNNHPTRAFYWLEAYKLPTDNWVAMFITRCPCYYDIYYIVNYVYYNCKIQLYRIEMNCTFAASINVTNDHQGII